MFQSHWLPMSPPPPPGHTGFSRLAPRRGMCTHSILLMVLHLFQFQEDLDRLGCKQPEDADFVGGGDEGGGEKAGFLRSIAEHCLRLVLVP